MNEFVFYLKYGIFHILDTNGYDHILFVVALCAVYTPQDWKRVLILITAFTVGHSITLVLATLDLVAYNKELIEFIIPITIFITAVSNLFKKPSLKTEKIQINYLYAVFFGTIHGLAFAGPLSSLFGPGQRVLKPLLAFNLGIEGGQITIVAIFMVISFIFVSVLGTRKRDWNLIISSAIAGISLVLLLESDYWQNII